MTKQPKPRVPMQMEVLDRLPSEEREILILSGFYGLALDEIASVIGTSIELANELMSLAQIRLRWLLVSGLSRSQAA